MNNRKIIFNKSERKRILLGAECGDTQLFNNMFIFIDKNKKLKKAIDEIPSDDVGLAALKESISLGDFKNKIYQNNNAANYLLRLIRDNDVSYQVGMNAYFSLLASQGASYLKKGQVRFVKISDEENQLSNVAEYYISNLKKVCDAFQLNNVGEELTHYILNDLSPSEKYFMLLEYEMPESYDHKDVHSNELLAETLAYNVPFFSRFASQSAKMVSLYIPSLSIMNFVLSKIYDNPVKIQFFFGSCSADSLLALHANGVHPVSIIHPLVSSNLLDVHGFECGPFLTALHDVGHAFWGSVLNKSHRDIIFDALIPAVNTVIHNARGSDIPLEVLYWPYHKLIDFDLSPISHYINPDLRFEVYVTSALSPLPQSFLGKELFDAVDVISTSMKKDKAITLPQLLKFNVDLAGFISQHAPEADIQKAFFTKATDKFGIFKQQDDDITSVPDPDIKFYK